MTKELLQQCLDALIESRGDVDLCYAGVKAARLSFRQERQLGFYEEQLIKHDAAIEALKQALAQQEQPASVDAYVGAREDAAIWKKRALEAEELNRQFIADVNGPTYLGGPVKQEQPAQETCWCDQNNIGEPGVSCGDCPTRDYKQPALSDLIELAKVYSQQYASPHHIVFSVDGLRHLIEAHLKGQK